MDWLLLILCLPATLFLGDESTLLPLLVLLPVTATVIKNIHRKKDIFSPYVFFPSYYLLWMGCGYAVSFYQRSVRGWSHPNFSQLAFLLLLAYLSWMIGLHFPKFKIIRFPKRLSQSDQTPPGTMYNRVMQACLIILTIGLAGSVVFYLGGALRILLSGAIEETRVAMFFGRGYLYFLAKSINTVVPIYVGTKWYFGKKLNVVDYWLLIITLLLVALPFSRRPILWFVITLIILFHYLKDKITYKKALFYSSAILFVAVIMLQIRSPGRQFTVRFFHEISVHVENITLYLQNLEGIGRQGLTPFLMNLKMLLPGHQIDFGLWLKEKLDLTFVGGGISLTLIGEGMISARIAGVVLGPFLIGYILKLSYLNLSRYFSLRNLFIYIILLYKAAEAINYGLALLMISTLFEIGLVLIIIPTSIFYNRREPHVQ